MSSEHKKPLVALVVITVACCVFMGYTVRANALIGGIIGGERAPAFIADALRLGGGATPEAPAAAHDDPDRSEAPEPRNAHSRSAEPTARKTAQPVARPGFGKHRARADKAGRTFRPESRRASAIKSPAARSHANRSSHGNRDHQRGNRSSYGHGNRSSYGHGNRSSYGHGNRSSYGHGNRSSYEHGNRGHQRGHEKHQRGNRSSYEHGNRGHQRGHEKHQRSRGHDRGNHGRGHSRH
ncbi:hypothetical protein ASG90_05025 [Nocardioides sp. Soil797]|nr:hypothetical protein ASG90_05025 [Nocardioides sp. Soil797]